MTKIKQQIHERIMTCVIAQGGKKEYLDFFDQNMAWYVAEQLIEIAKKVEGPFVVSNVNPLNDILANLVSFHKFAPCLEKNLVEFRLCSKDISQNIELIKCEPAEIETTLKEISDRGYVSVPSPYLLGLGIHHYHLLKDNYSSIISLDLENIIRDESDNKSFMYLSLAGKRKLYLAKYNGKFNQEWWFAVVRKENKKFEVRRD